MSLGDFWGLDLLTNGPVEIEVQDRGAFFVVYVNVEGLTRLRVNVTKVESKMPISLKLAKGVAMKEET